MSLSASKAYSHPSLASAPAPYVARSFQFDSVQGLSQRTLELHRGLYEGYVKECNTLLPIVNAASEAKELSPAERLESDGLVRRFAFERNGMLLHELFFAALRGPSNPPQPKSTFSLALTKRYGTFAGWRENVQKIAQTRGVGWVLTVYSPSDARMSNVWIDEHTHGVPIDCTVVCAFDLWEHAYLIDYKPSERQQYMQTLFDNFDWAVIESRCEQ